MSRADRARESAPGTAPPGVPVHDPAWEPLPADFAESTVSRRFEERVSAAPEAIALVGPHVALTAEQVDRRANQIAHRLRAEAATLGRPVAIRLPHDVDLVMSILGVWKAGGIVLVLDPEAPADVTAAIIADAGPAVILTDPGSAESVRSATPAAVPIVTLDDRVSELPSSRPPLGTGASSPAMLAYTSGTTGGAKAAVLPHRALLHLTVGATDGLKLSRSDRLPMLFPVSMAVAAYPMLLPLLVGGSLHVRDVRSLGLVDFHDWLASEGITVLYLSPTVARFLGDSPPSADLGRLRLVVLGGERVDDDAVSVVRRAFGAQAVVANGYGTTETGVLTFHVVAEDEVSGPQGVPVGHPISGVDLSVVGPDGRPVAPGEVGEILVRGDVLFSGYWRRPDLDARVFFDPGDGEPASYRTGDLALVDDRGRLVLVGRSDTEVKVRGHRVIPGEVEQGLLALPEVLDAVVEPRPDEMGTNELVAWIVPAGGADRVSIRRAAAGAMRSPMVPALMVLVPELPLLPNGKLDRQALPDPDRADAPAGVDTESGGDGPRDETEAAVAHIWHRILGGEPIGIHTDLVERGAQSLDVAWALVRIEEDLGVRIPMGALVEVRTVAELAERVEDARRPGATGTGIVEVQRGDADRPRLYMVHDLHGSAYGLRHLAPELGSDQPLWGFESPYLEGPEVPFRSLDTLALRYVTELQMVQPTGPYHLGGYSFGGVLAFEIARQLEAAGEEVAFLAVIDVGPGYRGRHYDPRKVLDKPWLRVPMPDDGLSLVEEARWYGDLARRSPKDLAANVSIRTGLDRWLDPLLFRYELRRRGAISAGNRLWYAWRKHWELARRYEWEGRTYAGPMTLLWADESASTDGTMGWGDVVSGDLDIAHVPVAHERLLQPDGAEVIGPLLRAALDRTENRSLNRAHG